MSVATMMVLVLLTVRRDQDGYGYVSMYVETRKVFGKYQCS